MVTLSLNLGSFKDVTLFSPVIPKIRLDANESQQIRFGTGSNSQINSGRVQLSIDAPGGAVKPTLTAVRCM